MSESLYQLTTEMQALNDLLEQLEGELEGSSGDTLVKWMDEYNIAMRGKVDSYGALMTHLNTYADNLKTEEKRLYERRKVFENRVQRLKDMAYESMKRLNVKKLEGERHTLSICKAGGKQALNIKVDVSQIPDKYIEIIPEQHNVNQDRIREGIEKNDPELIGKAELIERSEYVKLK